MQELEREAIFEVTDHAGRHPADCQLFAYRRTIFRSDRRT